MMDQLVNIFTIYILKLFSQLEVHFFAHFSPSSFSTPFFTLGSCGLKILAPLQINFNSRSVISSPTLGFISVNWYQSLLVLDLDVFWSWICETCCLLCSYHDFRFCAIWSLNLLILACFRKSILGLCSYCYYEHITCKICWIGACLG